MNQRPVDRCVTCVPLLELRVAAGPFGDLQKVDEQELIWVTVDSGGGLARGMFVADGFLEIFRRLGLP